MAYRALVAAGSIAVSGPKSTYFASGAASKRDTSSGSSTIRTVPFRCTPEQIDAPLAGLDEKRLSTP